jgi:hypothetical protein
MSTNINSLENTSPFHDRAEKVDSAEVPSLLPRSAWANQVAYLRVLFRVKKRLDRIEDASSQLAN